MTLPDFLEKNVDHKSFVLPPDLKGPAGAGLFPLQGIDQIEWIGQRLAVELAVDHPGAFMLV